MCAKKYEYKERENEGKKAKRNGPQNVVIDRVTGGIMFDTYQSIKDLEKEGKFSEKQAASIVKIISRSSEQSITNLATKQDIELLKKDIGHLEEKMNVRFESIEEKMNVRFESIEARMATKEDLAKVLTEVEKSRVETTKNHSNLLKWLMWIAVGMTTTVVSAVYYMIKYLPAIQAIIQNTPR